MKNLREQLLGLPAPEEDTVMPATFYAERGFTAAEASRLIEEWIDLGLEEEEVDIMNDALMHAWSILAYFGGKDGREFLLDELRVACNFDDTLFVLRFSDLMLAAGPETIPELIAELKDAQNGEGVLIELASALTEFAREGIDRDAALGAQVESLQGDPRHRSLKGLIIADLVELKEDRYLPQIRQAFEANLVDVSVNGDLEDAEIALGVRAERSGPAPHWSELEAELAKEALQQRIGPRPDESDDAGILHYFLGLHGGSCSVKSLVELDGMLLATILAPTMVRPSRWLLSIWDPENLDFEPDWGSQEDEQLFLTAVMNWHNGIIHRLDQGKYSPPIKPRSDLRIPTEEEIDWASGILSSVMNWQSSGGEPSDGHQALMAGAYHLIQPADDSPDSELIQVDHVVHAAHMLREALQSGGAFPSFDSDFGGYGHVETYEREAPKVGRNAPCPCGSGRKYKRCCMN